MSGLKGTIVNPEAIYGKSAYEIAVMHGFEGTEEEWLASLKSKTDLTYDHKSKNAQSGIAVAEAIRGIDIPDSSVKYFNIESNGTIFLKPEYRGAAIEFSKNDTILDSLGTTNVSKLEYYSKSDNGFEKNGSLINSLPEVLYIPSEVGGITVTKLAPAMFAYNKRVKQVVLPQSITAIPNECFAYAINLTDVKNVESVTGIAYGAFFASGIIELSFPNLTNMSKRSFMKSGHLKRINLGKITSIPDRCFEHCTNLETIDNSGVITTVGTGAFFSTCVLKKADFVSSLRNIGDYAFNKCALNFDWVAFYNQNGDSVTYGTRATPIQSNPSILESDFDFFNMKTEACELPAPLRIEQGNPEWSEKELGNADTYNTGCMFFSTMNAYCGIKGLYYDEPYSLVGINEAISVPPDYVKEVADGNELNECFLDVKETNRYPKRFGEIIKYVGDSNSVEIQKYTHPSDLNKATKIENTGSYFINGHNYRLMDTADKVKKERTWTWDDLGDRELTNIDLFASGSTYATVPQWYKGLGLEVTSDIIQSPAEYANIISALQNGSYVILNVPNGYSSLNGHAILLYGVKSNGEVLFVDSSVPSLIALEDYRAITGSMFLQNLIPENRGIYTIISEGETKTLLNETVDNETAKIYKIIEEIMKQMNIDLGMKTYYEEIALTETVQYLDTISVDFEPKIITFGFSKGGTRLFTFFPTVETGNSFSGLYNFFWVRANSNEAQTAVVQSSAFAKLTNLNGENQRTIDGSADMQIVTVEYNSTTNKWDITIGMENPEDNRFYKIVGKSDMYPYKLFVAG